MDYIQEEIYRWLQNSKLLSKKFLDGFAIVCAYIPVFALFLIVSVIFNYDL